MMALAFTRENNIFHMLSHNIWMLKIVSLAHSMFVVQKQYLEYWLEESEIAQSSRLIVKLFSFCILQTKCVIM